MNLDELLKVNSVRCIKTKVQEDLVEGEIYKVEGFNDETIKIVDRNGFSSWHNKNLFEPILNNDTDLDYSLTHLAVGKNWKETGCNHVVTITEISSEFADSTTVAFESDCCLSSSPLEMFLKDFEPVLDNNMSKSNSEIDISENSVDVAQDNQPIFKVGDKVYVGLTGRVAQVTEIVDDEVISVATKHNEVRAWVSNTCHATQENYEMLLKLYPHIEFEQPPKEITGGDLCCSMLRNKHTNIMCQVGGWWYNKALKYKDLL